MFKTCIKKEVKVMKSWINQHKRQIQTLIFCQILTIICFGQWFGIHYNADGYMTNIKDWNVLAADMVDRNVRPVTAAFYFIFGLLNLNYKQVFTVQTALFIISNSIQLYVIYKLAWAQKDKHNSWILLAQAQTVFTPYLISTMVFIEYGIMSLQIALQIIAVYQTVIDKKTGLSIADKDSNIEKYFSSNNWTTDSDDLYIFKDNILHLCAY